MKILVVTGASGGHIFPALSFLEALKDKSKGVDALLVLPRLSLKYNIALPLGLNTRYISIRTIKLKNIFGVFDFCKGFLESLFILLDFKPDAIVGFGSLASIPLIFWGWLFRIKMLIHEQNVIPGRANRLLAAFADKIAVSFCETKDYWRRFTAKLLLTGNPIRKELELVHKDKALNFFGLSPQKFTILVMGGSLGSHKINLKFLECVSMLPDKSKLQVIHLAGFQDYDLLQKSYQDQGIDHRCFRFLRPMQYAYSAADLVICRAGATTITELIFFRLPAIIIPYPFAYAHQLMNARVLENKGCALIIKDSALNTNILKEKIQDFISHPDEIKRMCLGYNDFPRINARVLLADTVLTFN